MAALSGTATSIVLSVEGADAAARDLGKVSAANEKVATTAKGMGGPLDSAKAAFGALGGGVSKASEWIGKLTFLTGGLGALFGGMLPGVIGGLVSAFDNLTGETERQAKYQERLKDVTDRLSVGLKAQAAAADVAAAALSRMMSAGRAAVAAGLGVDSAGLTGSGLSRADAEGRAMESIALRRTDLESRYQVVLDKRRAILAEANRAENQNATSRYLLMRQAKEVGDERLALEKQLRRVRDDEVDRRRALGGYAAGGGAGGGGAKPGGAKLPDGSTEFMFANRADAMAAFHEAKAARSRELLAAADARDAAAAGRDANKGGGGWADVDAATEKLKHMNEGLDVLAGAPMRIQAAFQGMADPIGAGLSMVTGAVQELSMAIGTGLTNAFLKGESTQKSAKKIAGEIIASLSAQAFGYSVLLGALGVAAALVPGLNLSAPGIFAAAGIMAGAGVVLAGTARMLGAAPVGGAAHHKDEKTPSAGSRPRNFDSSAGAERPNVFNIVLGVGAVNDALVTYSNGRNGSTSASRVAVTQGRG